jgi:hypothetical protein
MTPSRTKRLNAIAVANRFASFAASMNAAHLVSLEGFEKYLGQSSPPPGPWCR